MVFPCKNSFEEYFYGFSPPVWGGTLPIHATMKFSSIMPAWLLQRIYLSLIILLAGISMHLLVKTESSAPKYFAGILYAVNPFVYVRFLAGHWFILLAYSIMPFAVKSFIDLLEDEKRNDLLKSLFLTTLVGAINSHILVLLSLVYVVLAAFKLYQVKSEVGAVKRLLASLSILVVLYLLLNLYWLLPLLTADATLIHQISEADMYLFATKTSAFNAVFTIASMYGFWRGGYLYPQDFIPHWYLFFLFILFLAVHGFISNCRSKTLSLPVRSFAVVAVIAVVLGSGVYGPFHSFFELLFNNIFFFRGLRDSHKFAALLAFSYSYLGALGVYEFEKIARSTSITDSYRKIGALAVVLLALITPFLYSFTIFNGFWGQMNTTDYPDDWYQVNELLNRDDEDFNVLFLPWHAYMDFKWIPNTQKRIANPASGFFEKPVIQGWNMESGGIYSQSTNPAQRYVESLLYNKSNITSFGEKMVILDVKYVLLTKEVDYDEYFFLFNQTDLELIKETENFYVFKNNHPVSRFYRSPTPVTLESWREPDFVESLTPISYRESSPVKFDVRGESGFIVFVPPNLDSRYWEFEGTPSLLDGFYAVYPAGEGSVYYTRFNICLIGYLLSLLTLIGILGTLNHWI